MEIIEDQDMDSIFKIKIFHLFDTLTIQQKL